MAAQRQFNLQEVNYPVIVELPHPFERTNHGMVSHGEDIYVWGGMNMQVPDDHPFYAIDPVWAQTNPFFREMWKYSYASQRWQLLQTRGQIPQHLAAFGMCIIGDIIFVYGGTGIPYGVNNSNRLYSFDINTQVWTLMANQLAKYPLNEYDQDVPAVQPNPLYHQAVIGRSTTIIESGIEYNTGFVYVFGGANGNVAQREYDNNIYEYSLRTTLWTSLERAPFGPPQVVQMWLQMQHPPEPRFMAHMVFHNDRIYILGGGTYEITYPFDLIKVYHLRGRDYFTLITTADNDANDVNNIINNGYPQGRRGFACAQYRHEVFIIGGTNGVQIFDDIWKLDLETLRWKLICRMPNPVMFHSASVSDYGILSIFGGVISDGLHTRHTRRLLCMYLRVQTLADMAYNSIPPHHIQFLQRSNPALPDRYMNRLGLE